jgi:hypothetical protein
MAASLVMLLSGCSGGGGGKAGDKVDPAPAYKGVTTQATVSQANAEALSLGGFGGGRLGSSMQTLRKTGKGSETAGTNDRLLRQLAEVIKKSTARMEIPKLAKNRAKAVRSPGAAKVLQRRESFQINGDSGGDASYTMDINDSTGSFSGSVSYHDYSSQGIMLSGNADILGTLDVNRNVFSRLTLSFKDLAISIGNSSYTLIGTLSWGFNLSNSNETLSINMVLLDQSDSKTYWFRDYEQVTTYGDGFLTQTTSGRYYEHDQGYVDFTTRTPLVAYYGNAWPSQGDWQFSGQLGSWARLSFLDGSLLIEADTDGNGSADWQTERPTNSLPVTNSPPVANAGLDQSVSQWATVTLDGGASNDPDGDPLSYSWWFDACPQNACPSLSNSNTATPAFVADRPGTYVLRLAVYDGQSASSPDTVTVTASPTTPSDPAFLQMQWQYGVYGTSIGQAGLLTSDLDGDGTREIITSGSNTFWYVVRKNAGGTYDQIWRSENYGVRIVRLALADVTGDGRDDVVVGLADGTIRIYNGATLQETMTVKSANSLAAMAVADLDGDGTKEIVTSDGIGVFVYSAGSGGLMWSISNAGGSSIAVGNVDGDPALEIVTTSYGGKGYIIDGVSRVIEWEYVNSFGAQLALGDLDGDGMQEIVGASAWSKISVFDADRKTPNWEIPTAQDIGALLVADTDGDAVPEIIYGDGQWGKLHAVDAVTREQKWSVNNPEHGVSGIALGDVDRDGKQDLLWGSYGSSSGIYVADPLTGTIKWQSMHLDGPLSAVAVGDLDDDGEDEILMVSRESDSGYGEGVIHIFNARTHVLEYQEKLGIMDWMGVRSVAIGDVDGDGRTEFVVTTADVYDGVIRVYDGATHTLKRQSAGYSGNYFTALAVGDVDNDGKLEIVAGQGREHSGAQGVYLIVFDGETLQEKWRSVDLGSYWSGVYDIKLADLDGDGHPDIIASVAGSRLVVFDGVTHDLKLMIEHPSRALEVADTDGDGVREILAGQSDGKIDVFDGKTFILKKTVFTFSSAPIDALQVEDLDGNGSSEWLVTSGGVLSILEAQGQGLKWRSRDLSGHLGDYNHLAVRDTNGNGRKEIFLGADLALYQFE